MALVREQFDSRAVRGAKWSRIPDVAADLGRAYEHVGWKPLWIKAGRPTQAARGTVKYLGSVGSVGLKPDDYDADALEALAKSALRDTLDEAAQAKFEMTLSVATTRLLSSLRWGRVQQPEAYQRVRKSRAVYDLSLGLYAASLTPEPAPVFEAAAPPYAAYRALAQALIESRRLSRNPIVMARADDPAVTPGMPFPQAPALRNVLRALGEAPPPEGGVIGADTIYANDLSEAVIRFQKENGRTPTGLLDAGTRTAMRRLFELRAARAELALERWRWLPREADRRAIIVNVPEYRLHAYEEIRSNARPSFTMKVVVGKGEEKRFTPMFTDEMEHIIFSPYWEVPQTIAVDEIVPKATIDPDFLARNRYVLVKGYSDSAPQIPADSASLAGVGRNIRVRQLPGDYNALGRVKFMLPNHLNIYLHDTNEKHLFQRTQRAFSHGCVRVSDPNRLAEWALSSDSTWTIERMREAMTRKDREGGARRAHSRHDRHHTAAVDADGVLRAYRDV
jgi:murein L,D-transpeptidase YcbB/YkuD